MTSPFALWKKHRYGGDYTERLGRLVDLIEEWDLFLAFLIVDGCTDGKSTEPLDLVLRGGQRTRRIAGRFNLDPDCREP